MDEIVISAQLPAAILDQLDTTQRCERLTLMARELFGVKWRDRLATEMRKDDRTVRRWLEGGLIPTIVLVSVGAMLELDRKVARVEHYG